MAHNSFADEHRSAATAVNEYFEFEMPEVYSGVEPEFDAAIQRVAIVDRSWMGRIEVTGSDRLDLLHRLSTNNLLAGKSGQIIPTVFTTDKARIVDYVSVLIRDASLLLLTSPANEREFSQWIDKYTIMEDIRLNTVTRSSVLISLIGPQSKSCAESVVGRSLSPNCFVETDLPFCGATIAYRNEFETDIVDIIADAKYGVEVWRLLLSAGEQFGMTRMGTRAYEAFRIARGIPTIGSELTNLFNPYEAGLLHAINFTKGCYIGQEVIARLDTYQKIQNAMYGVVLDGASEPIEAGSRVTTNGEDIGLLTSVSGAVIRGKRIGLGILKKGTVHADDHVSIVSPKQVLQGVIRSIPVLV